MWISFSWTIHCKSDFGPQLKCWRDHRNYLQQSRSKFSMHSKEQSKTSFHDMVRKAHRIMANLGKITPFCAGVNYALSHKEQRITGNTHTSLCPVDVWLSGNCGEARSNQLSIFADSLVAGLKFKGSLKFVTLAWLEFDQYILLCWRRDCNVQNSSW